MGFMINKNKITVHCVQSKMTANDICGFGFIVVEGI